MLKFFKWFVLIIISLIVIFSLIGRENSKSVAPTVSVGVNGENIKIIPFRQMMEERNDYPVEREKLEIVSETPLRFILRSDDAASQAVEYKLESVRRAALYGVYRTFIHTSEPSVEVTSYVLDIESFNPYRAKENKSVKAHISVTKSQALAAVSKLIPNITSLQDLVIEDRWTDAFDFYYMNAKGQQQLFSALRGSGADAIEASPTPSDPLPLHFAR